MISISYSAVAELKTNTSLTSNFSKKSHLWTTAPLSERCTSLCIYSVQWSRAVHSVHMAAYMDLKETRIKKIFWCFSLFLWVIISRITAEQTLKIWNYILHRESPDSGQYTALINVMQEKADVEVDCDRCCWVTTWDSAAGLGGTCGPHWPRWQCWVEPQTHKTWWRMTADGFSRLPVDMSKWLRPCPHIWQNDRGKTEVEVRYQTNSDLH